MSEPIQIERIVKELKSLAQQEAQVLAQLHALKGAQQVLKGLLHPEVKPEEGKAGDS